MVEVKVDLMGAEPYLYIQPEVFMAIRKFFAADPKERLLYLHGTVDNETRCGFVDNITIPPQTSEHSSVELDVEHDNYFEWHEEYTERCKESSVIGMAHSFSGGAHHSPRDENTDALFGEESFDRGSEWFFSVTAHSGGKGKDFRVDAIFTPMSEAVKEVFFKQMAIQDIGWDYNVDYERIEDMLKDEDTMVSARVYVYDKDKTQTKGQGKNKDKYKSKALNGADKKK